MMLKFAPTTKPSGLAFEVTSTNQGTQENKRPKIIRSGYSLVYERTLNEQTLQICVSWSVSLAAERRVINEGIRMIDHLSFFSFPRNQTNQQEFLIEANL